MKLGFLVTESPGHHRGPPRGQITPYRVSVTLTAGLELGDVAVRAVKTGPVLLIISLMLEAGGHQLVGFSEGSVADQL